MRRVLPLLALAVLAGGVALGAGGDRGDGVQVARATPTDDVAHPGSRTEWWYVHAVDPASGRVVVVTFFAAPLPLASGFLFTPGGMTDWAAPTGARLHTGPGTTTAAGSVRWDAARGAWLVEQDAAGYRVRLRLTEVVEGLTAGPLAFGEQSMSWTVPVATSRADGEIVTPAGERIVVDRWRGYHDHNWGDFELESDQYQGWEWAVVHEPGERALLLGGIVPADGRFRGVVARFGPEGAEWCRPRLDRREWQAVEGFRAPAVVEARCDGEVARFTVTRPYTVRLTTHALTESVGRSEAAGSLGLVEHLARAGG